MRTPAWLWVAVIWVLLCTILWQRYYYSQFGQPAVNRRPILKQNPSPLAASREETDSNTLETKKPESNIDSGILISKEPKNPEPKVDSGSRISEEPKKPEPKIAAPINNPSKANANAAKPKPINGLSQWHPELIKAVRQMLVPPSTEPYRPRYYPNEPKGEQSMGQAQLMMQLFRNKTRGFFVECGAFNGQTRSNSLTLEQKLKWEGLLVEGDPNNVNIVRSIHRKSWLLPTCLSIERRATEAFFLAAGHVGRIVDKDDQSSEEHGESYRAKKVKRLCVPLYSALMALNRTRVDYFSLDVEGFELNILKTIPFEQLDIKALSVEYAHIGKEAAAGNVSADEMVQFMRGKGYKVRARVINSGGTAHDYIFVKNKYKEDIVLKDIIK